MGVPGGWAFVEGTQTTVKVRDLGGQVVIEDGMILAVKGAIVNSQSFFGSSADKHAGAVAYVKDCLLWWHQKNSDQRAAGGTQPAYAGPRQAHLHRHSQQQLNFDHRTHL